MVTGQSEAQPGPSVAVFLVVAGRPFAMWDGPLPGVTQYQAPIGHEVHCLVSRAPLPVTPRAPGLP